MIDSMPIKEEWDLILPLLGSNAIKDPNDAQKILGVPDSMLELQGSNQDVILWLMEVTVSQCFGDIMRKIKEYMEKCEGPVMMIVIIIHEARAYSSPEVTSSAGIWAKTHKTLLNLEEWQHDDDRLVDGLVQSVVPHRWMDRLDITIKVWLHHPDGHFSFDDANNLYGRSAQLTPEPCTGMAGLEAILKRGMVAIRNSIIDFVEKECEHSQEDLRALREWMPPMRIFNWDEIVDRVHKASLRDAHKRYKVWHTANGGHR
ncbi:hypothetical protein BDR06DRAFT_1039152 [Suillus hirtellus]|nr:hypothetical protein BDR06DRAFT_1039152 [Suillus hirtellus]